MANKFTIGDFIHSDHANRNKINNTPGVDEKKHGNEYSKEIILENAQGLFKNCIQPLKEAYPNLAISSGFRCKKLNSDVGGVKYSNHLFGEAADVYDPTGEFSSKDIFEWILMYVPKFYQVILEYPERGKSKPKRGTEETFSINDTSTHRVNSWVHIAYVKDDYKNLISLASQSRGVHDFYKKHHTERAGDYTHYLNPGQFNTTIPLKPIIPSLTPLNTDPPSTLPTTGLSTTGGAYFGG